jgi:Holliday junction resolvase RusA-like endonuclease
MKVSSVILSVDLPFPPAELNPNRRNGRHWTSTHDVKKGYRAECLRRTHAAGASKSDADELALSVTFVQPDKRKRDRDNLLAAAKNGLDAVAEALGVDDQCFNPVTVRREYGSKPGCMRVEVMG